MLNGPLRLSSSFPHCLEQRLNGTEYPIGKAPNGLCKPWVECSLTGVTLYARMKGILWKYLISLIGTYRWWRPPCLYLAKLIEYSCYSEFLPIWHNCWDQMQFSYKPNVTKYSYLKNKVVATKSTWNSVSTEDLFHQRGVGTAALATLAPTLKNSFLEEQSEPHSGCSGLSKSQLPVSELGTDPIMLVSSYGYPLYLYWQLEQLYSPWQLQLLKLQLWISCSIPTQTFLLFFNLSPHEQSIPASHFASGNCVFCQLLEMQGESN